MMAAQQPMVDEEMTEFFPYEAQLLHHPVPEPLASSPQAPEKPRGRGRRSKNANIGNLPNSQPSSNGASLGEPSGSGEIPVPGRRGVVIKTKFPVARIKRIMQADEDVGKVAQVTPVVVSKALELFMISLCDKAAAQARIRNSRRITAGHLKEAVLHEEQFDFLAEIIAKVPDIPLPSENSHLGGGANSGSGGDDDTAPPPQAVKKTRKPRQKKLKEGL